MRAHLKTILPLLIILLSLLLAALLILSRKPVQSTPPAFTPPLVETMTVEIVSRHLTVSSQGNAQPAREIQIVPQISGKVVHVSDNLVNGGLVETGEVLVRIEPSDYELAVIQANANVARAELRLQQEMAEASLARKEWSDLGGTEPTDLVLRKPQILEAQAGLEAAKAALESAELNLRRTEIRADFDGRIRSKKVDYGQFVRSGEVLGVLYGIREFEVRLPIPAEDLLKLGIPAVFQPRDPVRFLDVALTSSTPGATTAWQGKIVRTEGEIDPQTRMITLVARVEDPMNRTAKAHDRILPVGLFLQAEVKGLSLPSAAVLPRTGLREGSVVYLVNSESKLEFRQVVVAQTDKEWVVIESGLENGDLVCLSILDTAVQGMSVEPRTTSEVTP